MTHSEYIAALEAQTQELYELKRVGQALSNQTTDTVQSLQFRFRQATEAMERLCRELSEDWS